jgi:hypothetical protein
VEPLRPGDPRTVGGYRLAARLGEGRTGEVFLGRTPGGRAIAIKVSRPGLADDAEFRRRLISDVETARRAGGFHTAQIVDADPGSDPPWVASEYVAGPSLAAATHQYGRFPQRSLWVLGAGVAESLDAIHRIRLVHQNLKPSNVLLAGSGPQVVDFWIGRALEAGRDQPGADIGTPAFMAPEQITGGHPISPATDVFALGAVLCHASGLLPFGEGAPAALLYRIVHNEADLAGLPKDLLDVVTACLAKDPACRPTPRELLDVFGDGGTGDQWLPAPVAAMLPEYAPPHAPPSDWGGVETPDTTNVSSPVVQAAPIPAPGERAFFRGGKGHTIGSAVVEGILLLPLFLAMGAAWLPPMTDLANQFFIDHGVLHPRPLWPYGIVAALMSLKPLRDSSRTIRIHNARCDLHIGPAGLQQGRVGGPPVRYPWDKVSRATLKRDGDRGHFSIQVLPVPGTPAPPVSPKFYPWPLLVQDSGWVVIGHTLNYYAEPHEIELALIRFAGSRWDSPD